MILNYLILIVSVFLAGCGFHLRGTLPLAPVLQNIYIETNNPYGQFVRDLSQFLKRSKVNVVDKPENATAIFKILNETTSDKMLTRMVSQNNTVRQYQLILTITFVIADRYGKILIVPQTVTQSRTLTLNESLMLAGSNEARFLYDQMRQAIVYNIVSRLSSQDLAARLVSVNK